jgi:hypothetical protein
MLVKVYGAGNNPEKRYSPAVCLGCKTQEVTGAPDPKHISTSYVERQNLTMRMSMRRFARLTDGFSKKLENHAATVALYFMYYNFARVHQTLRVTPAMEAGIADQFLVDRGNRSLAGRTTMHVLLLPALLTALNIPVQSAATQTVAVSVNEVRQRAEQGDPAAQFDLGIRYNQGKDVPADPTLAADWFRKAAAKSNTDAMVQLGIMYGTGRGVPKDLLQAVSWFRQAAELGHASAQFNLGGMYARGEGVKQDFIEAYKWESLAITRAADRPDVPTFTTSRDAIAKQLTADQINEANMLIRKWLDEFGKKKH